MVGLPGRAVGRAVDHGFERGAQFAHEPHVLALEPEVGRVHLDELPDEDPRAGVGLVLVALGVGHGGADEVIHELELAADRDAELGKLGLFGGFRF